DHQWSEHSADLGRPFFLNEEKRKKNCDSRRYHEHVKPWSDDLKSFGCAEDGHRRGDHSIAVEKGSADQPERSDDHTSAAVAVAPLLLENQRKQRELTAFTPVVGSEYEDDVLDADDDDQRPDDERKNSVHVR